MHDLNISACDGRHGNLVAFPWRISLLKCVPENYFLCVCISVKIAPGRSLKSQASAKSSVTWLPTHPVFHIRLLVSLFWWKNGQENNKAQPL
jgi:hypothetical protein